MTSLIIIIFFLILIYYQVKCEDKYKIPASDFSLNFRIGIISKQVKSIFFSLQYKDRQTNQQ